MLKERTNYFKTVEGEISDFERDGCWVDLEETADGGAVVRPENGMRVFLDEVCMKLIKEEKLFDLEIHEEENEVIFLNSNGTPMPFDEVMVMMFG